MKPRKLNVAFVGFPYGGNGATSSEHPDIRNWLVPLVCRLKQDERIDRIAHKDFCDTPITMTRNAAVEWAQKEGIDVLVMFDSDQAPDMYLGVDPNAKPFFDSSFDFLYDHYDKGPVTIFAPYCGPPGHPTQGGFENVYVFKWQSSHSGRDRDEFKLDPYDRAEASQLAGIQEAGAGPTGLCMIDMRVFEHMAQPYFYYQFEHEGEICPHCHHPAPGPQSHKSSTEDVTFFRDMSLAVVDHLGYNPVHCNWDAWAGHWKPWCVGKPTDLKASQISAKLRRAYDRGGDHLRRTVQVRAPRWLDTSNVPFARVATNGHANGHENGKPHEFGFGAFMDEQDRETLKKIAYTKARECGIQDKRMVVVELGSWVGHSAALMAGAAKDFADFTIHCVDHFEGAIPQQRRVAESHDVYEEFRRNTAAFGESIVPHRMDTVACAGEWDGTPIDILFIDADHKYESVRDDIRA